MNHTIITQKTSAAAQPAWLLQPRFLPSSILRVPQSLSGLLVGTGSTTVVAVLNSNHYGVEYQNNVCLGFVHSSTPVAYPWHHLATTLAMICDARAGYEPYTTNIITQELYYFRSHGMSTFPPSIILSYHQLVWELSTPPVNSSRKSLAKISSNKLLVDKIGKIRFPPSEDGRCFILPLGRRTEVGATFTRR